jgi:hypothetical protein
MFYTLYFKRKVSKYQAGWCPRGLMSSIGKYKRNVLSYNATLLMSLGWALFSIFHHLMRVLYRRITPEMSYYIDSVLWIVGVNIFYVCLSLILLREDLTSLTERPEVAKFFISKHETLEPRRPCLQVVNTSNIVHSTSQPKKAETSQGSQGRYVLKHVQTLSTILNKDYKEGNRSSNAGIPISRLSSHSHLGSQSAGPSHLAPVEID